MCLTYEETWISKENCSQSLSAGGRKNPEITVGPPVFLVAEGLVAFGSFDWSCSSASLLNTLKSFLFWETQSGPKIQQKKCWVFDFNYIKEKKIILKCKKFQRALVWSFCLMDGWNKLIGDDLLQNFNL